MYKNKCRDCGKEYEYILPTSWCKECSDKFNTPEVIKAREEYQKTEAYLQTERRTYKKITPWEVK